MLEVQTGTKSEQPSVFDQVSSLGHEQVVFCYDEATGLKSIIGVHNTVLGPALGGTRMWSYANDAEALRDVLRLSRGMTYKNALAGLNLGGGKAVIIGNARTDKNEALLRRFGKFVESLNGKYITAEDVGMNASDMEYIAMESKSVTGIPESRGGSGDPSPFTALGTYMGMKAAVKKAYGTDSLEGKKIAIQGVGHVGEYLVGQLAKENCKIYVTDIYQDRLKEIASKYKVEIVGLEDIYDLDMDVYSPCALGSTINDDTLNRLKCKVIAGAANNQLQDERMHGERCLAMGIVYVPDFLINAGGVINVYSEVAGLSRKWVIAHTERLYDVATEVLDIAYGSNKNPQFVAMEQAQKRIDAIARIKTVR